MNQRSTSGVRAAAGLAAAAVLGGCAATAPSHPLPRLAPPSGWTLVWADEFDRDGLPDPARWVHDTGRNKVGWHNNEKQYYSAPRAENAVVRDGRLHLTARRESLKEMPDWGGQAYTSARLNTYPMGLWTYGFVEVRAKMPCGKGTWPAIWMLGTNGPWPAIGEIDILEHMGHSPQLASGAVHTTAGSAGQAAHGKAWVPTACTAFHDYQLLWTRDGLTLGVDGAPFWHYARPADPRGWPFDAPQFLILNLAIGGDLGGKVDDAIFPVTFEVDHVRVYQPAR